MTLKLNGSSSGYTAIDAPAAAGSNTLTLPADNGSANEFLQTNGSGTLDWAGAGIIKQVVSDSELDKWSNNTAEGALWDVSGQFKCDITTTSNSSKVLVFMNLSLGFNGSNGGDCGVQLTRQDGGSGNYDLIAAANGNAAGNRIRCHTFASFAKGGDWANGAATVIFLDTPGNAGDYSYSVKLCHSYGGSNTLYLNRTGDDTDASWSQRGACTAILAEI